MQKKFSSLTFFMCFILCFFLCAHTAHAKTPISQLITEYQSFMEEKGYTHSSQSAKNKASAKGTFSSLFSSENDPARSANKDLAKTNTSQGLSKNEAQKITQDLLAKRQENILRSLGGEWDSRNLRHQGYNMPFYIKTFGKAPSSGRSMYISLHGGGGTEARVNDQQWENQKNLYKIPEGVYFVPRSPTNTWNMWHQEYMDPFIEKAIKLAIIKEGVDPNKIYVMGYSAGGDGVYQLATRMPDLYAGAAMSAGHPGDAHIENLMNLPFGLYMGGQDSAYDRNKHAHTWKKKLDKLAKDYQGSYVHDVHIFPECGHWMEKKDAICIPFMAQYERNPIPYEVYWVQDDVLRDHFYWISTVPKSKHKNALINVFYNDEESLFYIENKTNVKNFIININDAMCDLDKSIKIYRKDKIIFEGIIPRSQKNIQKDVEAGRDAYSIFPAKILIEGMKAQVLGL